MRGGAEEQGHKRAPMFGRFVALFRSRGKLGRSQDEIIVDRMFNANSCHHISNHVTGEHYDEDRNCHCER